MSRIDVKDLKNEQLPPSRFPVEPHSDFRLHMAPEARRGMLEHAKADTSVEICGVLVGNWHSDENGPFLAITNYIRCDNASSKFAEVTFTHESWAQINKEMDSRFADARIVGWYHSHPDFGIFLSDRDCFIHEHFFSGPGQVAYVIDPVRDHEGIFAWRNGKPTPLTHYWVGDSIRTVDANERNAPAESAKSASAAGGSAQSGSDFAGSRNSGFNLLTTMAGVLLIFLLGFLYGGWRSRWEKQMIIDGAVAYFANAKILRPGLEDHLAQVSERIRLLANAVDKLTQSAGEGSKAQPGVVKRLKEVKDNLVLCDTKLSEIQRTYGYSDEERKALALLIERQEAELRRMAEAAAEGKAVEQSKTTQPDATKPGTPPPKSGQPIAGPKNEKAGPPDNSAKSQEQRARDGTKPIPPVSAPATK
jgi:proteasome lid subunit RPN8/RPN11